MVLLAQTKQIILRDLNDLSKTKIASFLLKHKQVVSMRRKMLFAFSKYLLSFQTYSTFLNAQINQVITSYTQTHFDQIWWIKISQPILSEMFDSLLYDFTECDPLYELKSFVTMETYWAPDFSNIKGFSGHLWNSILIFANCASYAWWPASI